jgi:hypothetical protein
LEKKIVKTNYYYYYRIIIISFLHIHTKERKFKLITSALIKSIELTLGIPLL